jgi:hypothetical protein
MSNTTDLDETIADLKNLLSKAKSTRDKLSITDRLLKVYGLKYKHESGSKGSRFAVPSAPAEAESAPLNGGRHGE